MNYYERYCGDYGRDTMHLRLVAHGAYTLLLDAQYSTERGLPVAYADLYVICKAMSKDERDHVRKVVDEYFPVNGDGLRWNKRAKENITEAQPRILASRLNGVKGGRKKKPNRNPVGSQQEPDSNPTRTQPGEASPYPIHHKTLEPKPSAAAPPAVLQETWDAWVRHKGKQQTEDADRLQRKHLAEWAEQGHDVNRIVENAVAGKWAGLHVDNKGSPARHSAAERRAATLDAVIRKGNDDGRRTITGTAERVDSQAVPALPGDLRQPKRSDVGDG